MRRPGGRKPLDTDQASDAVLARNVATRLLAGREHASAELSRKLTERGFTPAAISSALAELQRSNFLNDERFGQTVTRVRARRGQGPVRIRQELRKAGMPAELAEAALGGGEDTPDFAAVARQTRARKFGPEVPKDWKERAKQARFLQYRGFSNDHIRAALEGDVDDAGPDPAGEPDQS